MTQNQPQNTDTETRLSTDEHAEGDLGLDGTASRRGFMRLAGLLTGSVGIGLSDAGIDSVRAASSTQDVDDVDALNMMLQFERLHRDFYEELTDELDDALDGDIDDDDHEDDLEDEEDDLDDDEDDVEDELDELEEEEEEIEDRLQELEDEEARIRNEIRELDPEEDDRRDALEDELDDIEDDQDDYEEELDEVEEEIDDYEDELDDVEDDQDDIEDELDDDDDDDDHDDDGLQGIIEEAFEDSSGLHGDALERFHDLADHEEQHVQRVEQMIDDLGGTTEPELDFDFNDDSLGEFMATASSIGEATVEAYADIVPRIDDSDVALQAMQLCVVEARHAAFVAAVDGDAPFPEPFATRGSMADAEEFLEQFD